MIKYNYDAKLYGLQPLLTKWFCQSLNTLNIDLSVFKRENDQSTSLHNSFYILAHSYDFQMQYINFLKDMVYPIYNEPIIYQAIPTFRICFPNNVAVGEFHKDKNYRDKDWAEKVKEDNFFLPLTDAFDTNTIWVESEEDKGDFAPMNCKYGELIKWDGSNLTHGNKINLTGKTRVSIDFRVIQLSNYIASEHGSINTGTKFKIGEYYKTL